MGALNCLANTFGLMPLITPTISYVSGETFKKGKERFLIMSAAQFISCLLKEDLNSDYPDNPNDNAALASGYKYTITDIMTHKAPSFLRFGLGSYNGFAYSQDSFINDTLSEKLEHYHHPKMVDLVLPIAIEASESLIECLITQPSGCPTAILGGTIVGLSVVVAAETTLPLAKNIFTPEENLFAPTENQISGTTKITMTTSYIGHESLFTLPGIEVSGEGDRDTEI